MWRTLANLVPYQVIVRLGFADDLVFFVTVDKGEPDLRIVRILI